MHSFEFYTTGSLGDMARVSHSLTRGAILESKSWKSAALKLV